MSSTSKSTYYFDNVYITSCATVVGPVEHQGPLSQYFDVYFNDYYGSEKTFEKAEREMQKIAIDTCLQKVNMKAHHLDLMIGGDLTNQITASSYTAAKFDSPFVGIYGACSSSCLSIALASFLIETRQMHRILTYVSSHNLTAERQYRYPVEYGIQKAYTSTFTATGSGALLLSDKESEIRVESVTLGKSIDFKQKNINDMGKAMAPAAYDTLKQHFKDTQRTFSDYDLVVTGDLSDYGKKIIIALFEDEGFQVVNYNDCGTMLYNISTQNVFLGGSGCACSALVTYGYIIDEMKKGTFNRVLVVATGALMSPITMMQKETIPSIAHAICLERV